MRQRWFWHRETRSWEPTPPPELRRIHVINDEAEAFKSHADGKVYTSKTKYRAELRARGYEEVGNERVAMANPTPKMPDYRQDFQRVAWEKGLL